MALALGRPSSNARRRTRGAIFVEALIVIASFVLMLMGLIFFFRLYKTHFALRTLSRSAALAYSMAGCEGNEPRTWLGRDLSPYTTGSSKQKSPTGQTNGAPGGANQGNAGKLVNGNSTLKDGSSINPMVVADVKGRAALEQRARFGTTNSIFSKDLTARATVSCGDVVRPGHYSEVIGQVRDMMNF